MLRQRSPSTRASPGARIAAMEHSLNVKQNLQKRNHSFIWGIVNLILLFFFIYDLSFKCPLYTTWFNYLEYAAVLTFSLNSFYHFCRYVYFTVKTGTIVVTPSQKRLLGIKDTDSHYKVTDKQTSTTVFSPNTLAKTPDNIVQVTPINWSAASWQSNSSLNDSRNYSMPSPSWIYYRGSPEHQHQQSPQNIMPQTLQFHDTSGIEFIDNEHSLKQYLQDFEQFDKLITVTHPAEPTTNLLSSFWSHPANQNPNEVSPYLRRAQYQLSAQHTSASSSPNGASDENRATLNILTLGGAEVWRRLQIYPETIIQWNANLRMWISQTILERLITEMYIINDEFAKLHLNDVRIGSVGLERLRKTAQMLPVTEYVPTLTSLLPFLEATPNQEYLVKRMKELAKGGCMSDFKWNAGGTYNGKEWDDSLVTDSEIIIHLLATYLDCQLVPLPNQPEAKPFSKEHLIRINEKVPQTPDLLAIHQVTEKPPHFRLIVGDEVFEVAKGHNNLFYTILLFLYFVNKKEYGMLGKVNMGRSGVNMLWIIEGN